MILRPYQEQAIEELREGIKANPREPGLLVAPTGSGKSEIFGWMARSAVAKGTRLAAVVNRRILVNDLCRRVDRLGIEYGVIMAGHKRKPWAPVQIASFDTLWRNEHLPKWDLVFVDECHFSLADRYSKVLARLAESGTVIIGMTATPIRGVNEGLGSIYKWMVRCPDTPELIDQGYLVRPRVFAPPGPDVSKVKKIAGEFNQKELAQVCDNTKITGDILKHWSQNGRGRPTIGFGVDIAHCKHMAETFYGADVRSFAVDHTYKGDFDLLWRQLANYELEVVFNVGIAGYGWDCATVSCMIEGRPSQSPGLWIQHCGRVLRIAPGKIDAIINDHAGNCLRHGMPDDPREWSLDGDAIKPCDADKKPPAVATCSQSFQWPDGRHEPPNIIHGLQWPCYATFRAGPKECPYCGLPQKTKARPVEVQDGELQEIQRPANQQERIEAAKKAREQRQTYEALLRTARQKGYKTGWARHVFCSKFGFAPPVEWLPGARELKEALQG